MIDGELVEFDYRVGGKTQTLYAEDLLGGFTENTCTLETELVNAADVDASLSGELVALSLGAVEGKHQSVNFTDDVVKSISADTKRIVLRIVNPTDKTLPFMLQAKFKGSSINLTILTADLAPGENVLEVSGFGSYDWSNYESLERLILYFTDDVKVPHEELTVYVKDFVIYDN